MTEPAANTTKKRLLVVDDEPGFREFIQEAAAGLNIEVACAPDGEQAREIYASFKPDVILLDIVMPGVDGVEFTRWLAAEKTTARVVLVTGYNPHYAEATGRLGEALGIPSVKFLTKPLRLATLAEILND